MRDTQAIESLVNGLARQREHLSRLADRLDAPAATVATSLARQAERLRQLAEMLKGKQER